MFNIRFIFFCVYYVLLFLIYDYHVGVILCFPPSVLCSCPVHSHILLYLLSVQPFLVWFISSSLFITSYLSPIWWISLGCFLACSMPVFVFLVLLVKSSFSCLALVCILGLFYKTLNTLKVITFWKFKKNISLVVNELFCKQRVLT